MINDLYLRFSFSARGEEEDELVGLDLPSPKFISKGQKFRAVIGDTVRLPCQVDNLGKQKKSFSLDEIQ